MRQSTPTASEDGGGATAAPLADPAKFREVFDVLPDAVVICDTDGQIVFVNRETELLTGYSAGEVCGSSVESLIPAGARAGHAAQRRRYGEHPTARRMGTKLNLTLRCKDGTDIPVDIALSPVKTGEGLRIVAVVRDIRERLRVEAKMKAEADAEVARAKDELISLVSHEMRTPLASIVGFTEILMRRGASVDQSQRYLEIMLQEAKRLTNLINDFLDLKRLDGSHRKLETAKADIELIVRRAVLSFPVDSKVPIRISFPSDLPMVDVDFNAVLQVLTNLISNARKYSPDGGEILFTARTSGGNVEVSVEDHGLGLEPAELSKLFQKFYRTERAERLSIKGTGLGLAICRRIIEAHGGRIDAISRGSGKGATFTFTVPIALASPPAADAMLVGA